MYPVRHMEGGAMDRRAIFVAAVAVLVVLIVAIFAFRPGEGQPTVAPSAASSAALQQKLCSDIQGLQELRFDALDRLEASLASDQQAYAQAGDAATAAEVGRLVKAIAKLQAATSTGGDQTAATDAVLKALDPLPC